MRVLITGASKGIGKATAEIFKQAGYELEIPTHSELDLNSRESIENYVRRNINNPLDSLVNNAGINTITELCSAGDKDIAEMLMVDLQGPLLLLRGSIPRLKKSSSGRIINVASIWAVVSKKGRALYSAVKSGLHGVTNALSLELAEYGILVNTVCPGFTLTELTAKNNTAEEIAALEKLIPLGRMAQPQEIARLIYFLGSIENTYITGQKIIVDGGYTAQ